MKENIEEDVIKKFENLQNIDFITLIRQFKKEGIENFIVLRKNDFDKFLSDYKRVLKENEELKSRLKATTMVFRDKTIQTYRDNEIELTSRITDLQKENEELKMLIAHKNGYTQQLEQDLYENASNYVIPKQKIKDKIEEVKNEEDLYARGNIIAILLELLEEEK